MKPPRTQGQKNTSRPNQDTSQSSGQSMRSRKGKKNGPKSQSSGNDDSKKNATLQEIAYCQPEKKKNVMTFIDNGCSRNVISEELEEALNLRVHEDVKDTIEVVFGFFQMVRRPRRIDEMIFEGPGCSVRKSTLQVMTIPENEDVILGMVWLREPNSNIDWKTLQLSPRSEKVPEEYLLLRAPIMRLSRCCESANLSC
ncbi:hypothetical protein PsorP6_006397 [Peronosclerospora sorghi]|uniref:Uncharacterized protein n=1 Tax=Peronosclerospora sorghi TaxID=230839 RepID=A0ACC0W1B6_9STRA|nr:hypothetical protein PsorP6_006397 [Peronosclerospora sorghi]